MTTCSSLITDAYRESNLIPVGKTPTAAEQAEALTRLNALVASVFGEEMGENLQDWPVPIPQRTAPAAANFPQLPYPMGLDGNLYGVPSGSNISNEFAQYPPKNSRIIFGGVTGTVYLPEAPDDGSRIACVQGSGAGDSGVVGAILTLNGNGRTIELTPTKTFTFASPATASVQWVYHASKGDWSKVSFTMALSDDIGFPIEIDDYWVTSLAIRLAGRYGKTVSQETSQTYLRMNKKVKAKYRQAGTTVYKAGDVPNTAQSWGGNRWWW